MISPDALRRYQFFSNLSTDQIIKLARTADEIHVPEGHYFFHEHDPLNEFYIILAGVVDVFLEKKEQGHELTVSRIRTGTGFGWSVFFAPHRALFGAKAAVPSHLLVFRYPALLRSFDEDHFFGYLMMQKAAEGMRDRLHDLWLQVREQIDVAH
jgi:CRP-like cAMP-binding protein